jgi:hypothetical protein
MQGPRNIVAIIGVKYAIVIVIGLREVNALLSGFKLSFESD